MCMVFWPRLCADVLARFEFIELLLFCEALAVIRPYVLWGVLY